MKLLNSKQFSVVCKNKNRKENNPISKKNDQPRGENPIFF